MRARVVTWLTKNAANNVMPRPSKRLRRWSARTEEDRTPTSRRKERKVRKPGGESTPVSSGPARAEEAEAIAALIHRAFAGYRGKLQPEPSALRESADSIRSALETEHVFVARRDVEIIGCVSVQQRGALAYARRLAVDPAEQG